MGLRRRANTCPALDVRERLCNPLRISAYPLHGHRNVSERRPVPVYRRVRDRGRLTPEGIDCRGSWVTDDLRRWFQVTGCRDRRLLDKWIASWQDSTEFEVVPVMTSGTPLPQRPRSLQLGGPLASINAAGRAIR